ncbi:MAG: AMP-dependent synthetase and ligase [Verrucomicrobiales bacterium]|nr:AMP-dependent synthetase and ligase [Verrucomicrobiales bacterium]
MLYERWQQIAQRHRDEIALHDLARGERWSFGELSAAVEQGNVDTAPVVFPQGISSDFIFSVLKAWRNKQVVCPLEVAQPAPHLKSLPPDCIHLKMTSATTGDARVIAFKPEQLVADAENIVATMGLRCEWPNMAVISLAHSYGFSNMVLPLLLHGIPLILVESPLPENVRSAAKNFDAITLAAVPALWRVWNDASAIPANVRLAISAGAPLPLQLEAEIFAKTGIKVHNFYGSSECGGIAYDRSDTPRTDPGCVGGAMANVDLCVGEAGCLEVRSRAVGQTYWPQPDDKLANGIFRTSDVVELSDGMVFLRGRVTDQINVAGRKVSPDAIERILLQHPSVSECLVFGVPSKDAERTEEVVACIVAKAGGGADGLKQFLQTKIPAWQMPRDWWLVDSLEVNQRGKVSRAAWREKYLSSR